LPSFPTRRSSDLVASVGYDGAVHLWEAATGRERFVLRGHKGYVYRVAFSRDGKLLASGGEDNTVRLWDMATAKAKAVLPQEAYGYSLAFSPDGKWLAAGLAALSSHPKANVAAVWGVAAAPSGA